MSQSDRPTLVVEERPERGSRATRRLRREGFVPGVVYGGGGDNAAFKVRARELRQALVSGSQVLDLKVGDGRPRPVIVKEQQRHPVRGELVHVDLLAVRLDEKIHSTVLVELVGAEEAPAVKQGGVLEQATHELSVEALPTDLPERVVVDVSGLEGAATMHLAAVPPPPGVTFLDDPEETIIATMVLPTEEEAPGDRGGDVDRRRRGRHGRAGRASGRGVRGLIALLRRGDGSSSGSVDWLIVGLGNPGPRYVGTRHNVGFDVAELLARRWELGRAAKRFAGLYTDGRTRPGGPRVGILLPQTFMNDAGRSAGPARGALRVPLERVLVVHDEIDLPFGEVRSRLGGGLAGHNGLKSLKRELGGADFHRVRVGVGRPDSTDPEIVAGYVLARFSEPAAEVCELVERAADEVERVIGG